MIVYSVFDYVDGGTVYYATLTEAREASASYEQAVIEKLWLVDLSAKRLAVRLLNGSSFVARREEV